MHNFESFCKNYLNTFKSSSVKEAMNYAFFGDGKRFRPSLLFAVLDAYHIDHYLGYHCALALEMVHTYSLIHDDLPCMDDDDYRRGRLSTHKAFKEDTAVLAGDALLTESFNVIYHDMYLSDSQKLEIIHLLSDMAGIDGMIYGQYLDMESENNAYFNEDILKEIDDYKTGCLFRCALKMGAIIAKDLDLAFYDKLGEQIGRIFQLQDDLFEITKTTLETGKSHSDDVNNKRSAMYLYSIDEAHDILDNSFNSLFELIDTKDFNKNSLKKLIQKIKNR